MQASAERADRRRAHSGTWSLTSPQDGVLRVVQTSNSHVHVIQNGPLELAWNLHLDQGVVNLDQMQVHLELRADDGTLVFAAAPENPTWTWDDDIDVHLEAITADGKDLMASSSTVVAADKVLTVGLSTDFPGRNDAPANGSFQARMHLAVEGLAAGQLVPTVTWFNTSTAWVDLDLDGPDPVDDGLAHGCFGQADVRIELRTEANVTLVFEEDGTTFVLDAQAPALLGSSPNQAAYADQSADRNVIMSFAEVGGFHPDEVGFHVWVEGRDDGQNGGLNNGLASLEEYVEVPATWTDTGTVWTANFTVDDSANADHDCGSRWCSAPTVRASPSQRCWQKRVT